MSMGSNLLRGAAIGLALGAGSLYAVQSGLLGGPGHAETQAADAPRIDLPPTALRAPVVLSSADVRLPAQTQPQTRPQGPAIMPPVILAVGSIEPGTAPDLSALGLPCDVTVSAAAQPAAIAALDIMAPCLPSSEVSIVHSGLRLSARTDAMGLLTLDIPAFETPAYFSVTFADGTEDGVLVTLPDLGQFDRIGLSWQDDMALELHAMEFGASYGGDGHVWQGAPASADAAITASGGFLSVIDTGLSHAQIYTLPRAILAENETVRLSIDAPVTAENCARPLAARTLRTEAAGRVDVTDLTFTYPSCDGVGDVLVLQNLLDDLRLAAN